MTSPTANIPGGCVLLARRMIDSDLMSQSPLVVKLWVWFLLKANWKDREQLARGQLVTTIRDMQEAMSHYAGWRKITPTRDEIRNAYEALTKATRITTRRTTRGVVITILNYEHYQDLNSYASHTEAHKENVTKTPATPHDTEVREIRRRKSLSASGDAEQAQTDDFYLTKRKRKLIGKRLETFNRFWEAFNYKKDRASAADAWIDIPALTDSLVEKIIAGAEGEAANRPQLVAAGRTPKMPQGWITARRWEDEALDTATHVQSQPEAAPAVSPTQSAVIAEVFRKKEAAANAI